MLLKRRHSWDAQNLVDSLMDVALESAIFEDLSIPDTMDGRFDSVMAHMAIIQRYLHDAERQIFFDTVFKRIEMSLRQTGVGDQGLPHHIRRMIKAFYGRATFYDEALDNGDLALMTNALARNLYRDETYDALAAAKYFTAFDQAMKTHSYEQILNGKLPQNG